SHSVRIAGRISLDIKTYFDERFRVGRLYRYRNSDWELLVDGLDDFPRFGNWDRLFRRTTRGFLVGSTGSGPWLAVDDWKSPAVRLDWRQDFPLAGADRFVVTPDGELLALLNGVLASASQEVKRDPAQLRVHELKTHLPLLRDTNGKLWGFPSSFAAWTGARWIEQSLPPELAATYWWRWLPDEQNRGWLFTGSGKIGICDFATGEWKSFPSLRAALEAQLPHGSVVRDVENPFLSPVFGDEGKIGFFDLSNSLHYFAGTTWRTWDLREIGDQNVQLDGSPYFNRENEFCVPLSGRIYQWSDRNEVWTRFQSPDEPEPSTRPETTVARIPEDCPIQNPTSSATDSLGVCWLTSPDRVLHKAITGRTVRALDNTDPNPFRYGAHLQNVLIDSQSNAFLDMTSFGKTHRYILIQPKSATPRTTAELVHVEGDVATIRLDSPDAPAPGDASVDGLCFEWQLDDLPWQLADPGRELTIERLAAGKHQLRARAFDASLNGDTTPAVVEWEIKIDPKRQERALIAELAHPELDHRELAARALRQRGVSTLPDLRGARDSASAEHRWWIDAVIQQIERGAAQGAKREGD
ncbi:MAG: hypothetical protein ABI680_20750, partial [Chthoniobacteraceae bacterium]